MDGDNIDTGADRADDAYPYAQRCPDQHTGVEGHSVDVDIAAARVIVFIFDECDLIKDSLDRRYWPESKIPPRQPLCSLGPDVAPLKELADRFIDIGLDIHDSGFGGMEWRLIALDMCRLL